MTYNVFGGRWDVKPCSVSVSVNRIHLASLLITRLDWTLSPDLNNSREPEMSSVCFPVLSFYYLHVLS